MAAGKMKKKGPRGYNNPMRRRQSPFGDGQGGVRPRGRFGGPRQGGGFGDYRPPNGPPGRPQVGPDGLPSFGPDGLPVGQGVPGGGPQRHVRLPRPRIPSGSPGPDGLPSFGPDGLPIGQGGGAVREPGRFFMNRLENAGLRLGKGGGIKAPGVAGATNWSPEQIRLMQIASNRFGIDKNPAFDPNRVAYGGNFYQSPGGGRMPEFFDLATGSSASGHGQITDDRLGALRDRSGWTPERAYQYNQQQGLLPSSGMTQDQYLRYISNARNNYLSNFGQGSSESAIRQPGMGSPDGFHPATPAPTPSTRPIGQSGEGLGGGLMGLFGPRRQFQDRYGLYGGM